jgi:hypothetical protein
MAKIIEFYFPTRFHTKVKWVPAERRGKLIEFPAQIRNGYVIRGAAAMSLDPRVRNSKLYRFNSRKFGTSRNAVIQTVPSRPSFQHVAGGLSIALLLMSLLVSLRRDGGNAQHRDAA